MSVLEMGVKIIVAALCILFAIVESSASMVELNSEWKPNFGWEVTCSWSLLGNDSLQSVRLYQANQQYMIYRPENDGPKRSWLSRIPNVDFHTDCNETTMDGVTGKCIMALEMYLPIKDDLSFTCEVSGERPMFRFESKTLKVEALVPPSDAVVEAIYQNESSSGRVNVNCTSTGLPAPNLVWTIGDQKIPQDFSGSEWNATSKLYHVWSSLSYTPMDSNSHAVCTPEVVRGRLVRGTPAQYSAADVTKGAATMTIVLLILALTR